MQRRLNIELVRKVSFFFSRIHFKPYIIGKTGKKSINLPSETADLSFVLPVTVNSTLTLEPTGKQAIIKKKVNMALKLYGNFQTTLNH